MTRLIVPLSAQERARFLARARSFVGVPFKHRGRSRTGVDCLGLVACCLQAVGREPQDERLYGRDPEPEAKKLRAALVDHFGEPYWDERQPLDALLPGSVVSMRWGRAINHVGIVAEYAYGGPSIIHALKANERVIETRLAGAWDGRVLEGWLA